MSILLFAESINGKFKKSTLEAASYAAAVAKQLGTTAVALADGSLAADELASLGKYGIQKVVTVQATSLAHFDSKAYAYLVSETAKTLQSTVIVFSYNLTGKATAPRVAATLKAGLVAGAIDLPITSNGFTVKKGVFSGKAFAHVAVHSAIKVIAITPNSYKIEINEVPCTVEAMEMNIPDNQHSVKVLEEICATGKIPLTEAELVVSAGRGLKGPENWGMIEEMATLLGAATACSRAVADVHWRPHEEHVGQTGLTIRPNLYIAVGISGAIQHLAGVNQSKTIVVINTDKEAPFFKAADYGIIGDAFEVVPKLNEAFKKFKSGQS